MAMSSEDIDETRECAWGTNRLQSHAVEIAEFCKKLGSLQNAGADVLPGLENLLKDAAELQKKMNIAAPGTPGAPSREELAEVGIPVLELEQARSLCGNVQDIKEKSREASKCLLAPPSIATADLFEKLLATMKKFRQLCDRVKKSGSALANVDFAVDTRLKTANQTCSALQDQVLTTMSSTPDAEFAAKIKRLFVEQDWARLELEMQGIESPVPCASPMAPASQARMPLDMPRVMPRGTSAGAMPETMTMADKLQDGVPSAGGQPPPTSTSSATAANSGSFGSFNSTSNFGGMDPRPDPFGFPDPVQARQQAPPSSADYLGPQAHQASGSSAGTQRAAKHGTQELWHAVHVGDAEAVKLLVEQGLCNGAMKDVSCHSVLWHAIAFNHSGIANYMLETFPPGEENGCDMSEVHPRRGDTLLHLLVERRPFERATASIFSIIASLAPPALVEKENANKLTCFQIACMQMNFWVLKFICTHPTYISRCKNLCSPPHAMLPLAEVIPPPQMPTRSSSSRIPDHFSLTKLLGLGKDGFADVAFDLGPEGGNDAGERGRFLAHRVVIGAQSPMLLEEIQKLPMQQLEKEGVSACVFRVDPRIPKEVWRTAQQFLYTGEINCSFENNVELMVELLRACEMYQLPKPLLDFVQSGLFQLLPQSSPLVALRVFAMSAGPSEDGHIRSLREQAASIILRHNEVLQCHEPNEVAVLLEKLIQTVELAVFQPASQGSAAAMQPAEAEMQQQMQIQMQQQQMLQQQAWYQQQQQMQQMQMRAYGGAGGGGQRGGAGGAAYGYGTEATRASGAPSGWQPAAW